MLMAFPTDVKVTNEILWKTTLLVYPWFLLKLWYFGSVFFFVAVFDFGEWRSEA